MIEDTLEFVNIRELLVILYRTIFHFILVCYVIMYFLTLDLREDYERRWDRYRRRRFSRILRTTCSQVMIEEQTICCICLEELPVQQLANKLICDHRFHAGCINTWLQWHHTCPICRRKVY